MSKLNQKKLLSILETAFSHLLKDINYKETKAKYEQAHQQIKEMIQKPEVTEEWIEEKAKKICKVIEEHEVYMGLPFWENFIRSLVEEISSQ